MRGWIPSSPSPPGMGERAGVRWHQLRNSVLGIWPSHSTYPPCFFQKPAFLRIPVYVFHEIQNSTMCALWQHTLGPGVLRGVVRLAQKWSVNGAVAPFPPEKFYGNLINYAKNFILHKIKFRPNPTGFLIPFKVRLPDEEIKAAWHSVEYILHIISR